MYELKQASSRCYYIDCPSRIGIIKISETKVALIDTGSTRDVGKKVIRIVSEAGWQIDRVFITHAHGDHVGGNRVISERTGAKIYAPKIENCFAENTILEPASFSGAYPAKEIRNRFLVAEEAEVLPLTDAVLPEGVEIIPLPGHSFNMVGFLCDGVAFIADALSSETVLKKYGMGILFDVKAYLETLRGLSDIKASLFVPSHAEVTDNISPLAEINANSVEENIRTILEICAEAIDFDSILQQLFTYYGISPDFQQYTLVGSSLRCYLSFLADNGQIYTEFNDNKMLWKRA